MKSHYAPQWWFCEYNAINIYMVAMKGIYQVFTLGIRFSGWISVCSRAEWRIGNSVGGTWRDFIRGGRWWWHKTLKALLSPGSISESCSFFLLFTCLPLNMPLWHMDISSFTCWLEVREGKCFKGATQMCRIQEAGCLTFIVTALCSRHYLSLLLVVIQNTDATCSIANPPMCWRRESLRLK